MTSRLHAAPPVHFALLRRAVWLWLAVLLAVFGALGSTVSHALAPNRTPVGMEICTSMGMQWVDASGALDASSGQPLTEMPVDCPMCLLCADRLHPCLHRRHGACNGLRWALLPCRPTHPWPHSRRAGSLCRRRVARLCSPELSFL